MTALVTLEQVRATRAAIAPHVVVTPLVPLGDDGVVLKAESLQPSGAFKLRGAIATLLALDDDARARGVVAHSSGNHAVAVAHAARTLGVDATVVVPADAPAVKVDLARRLGARIEVVGNASTERAARAAELVTELGLHLVEPFDSTTVLRATATVAVEVLEALPPGPPVEIYVPISGGGLAGGVAVGTKLTDDRVRVIGVEPAAAARARASRAAGERVTLPAEQVARTIADGLRVQTLGHLTWPHIEAFVDELTTVTDDEILAAVRTVVLDARLVVEPSGAVAVAAATRAAATEPGPVRRVAIVSGGNVEPGVLAAILAGDVAAEPGPGGRAA